MLWNSTLLLFASLYFIFCHSVLNRFPICPCSIKHPIHWIYWETSTLYLSTSGILTPYIYLSTSSVVLIIRIHLFTLIFLTTLIHMSTSVILTILVYLSTPVLFTILIHVSISVILTILIYSKFYLYLNYTCGEEHYSSLLFSKDVLLQNKVWWKVL